MPCDKNLLSLRQLFRSPQCILHASGMKVLPANQGRLSQIDIIICTIGSHHVLRELSLPDQYYRQVDCQVNPRMLGFECHTILGQQLGQYDYYGFLEDDLVIHDPWFFDKLQWFNKHLDNQNLLQPNRYEISDKGLFLKGYIDGEINKRNAERFQDISENNALSTKYLGTTIRFRRTDNPHSGCFFLNSTQMECWAAQPHFLDRDISFVDPMASAATLGILKTFKIYKPAAENADFFEIEHRHSRYLTMAGCQLEVDTDSFQKIGYVCKE